VGSRLILVSVVGALLAASPTLLAQPGPLPSADYAKQGTDLYKAGNFAGAIEPLEKAVELEPNNFEYRYMLAQSYRQSGHCDKARPLYQTLVDAAPDAESKTDVQTNMALCPEQPVAPPPPPPQPTPLPPAPPEPVATSGGGGKISGSNMAMLMGAGVGLGAGVVLVIAGHNDSTGADYATTVGQHDTMANRSKVEYALGVVGLGAGVALAAVAALRIGREQHETTVSFRPHNGGGSFVLERSW
jgi:tetratricopeptide (TPR) repeat protein